MKNKNYFKFALARVAAWTVAIAAMFAIGLAWAVLASWRAGWALVREDVDEESDNGNTESTGGRRK